MKKLFKLFVVVIMMTALGCNISGTVKDKDGNPIEGATITLEGDASKTTTTDSEGAYSFSGLNIGAYKVTAEYEDMVFTYPTIL